MPESVQPSAQDRAKAEAAAAALAFVAPGMVVGLGTGSTAAVFVRLLAERVRQGLKIACTPTSEATHQLATGLGMTMTPPDDLARIDVTVDGADEVDPAFNLIKGGGAALLREKIIAEASDRMVVIADASKRVARLGAFALPIEINPFAAELTRRRIHARLADVGLAAATSAWRMASGEVRLRTDGGHLLLDLACGSIPDARGLSTLLADIPGVVEHGLFLGYADVLILGRPDGAETLTAAPGPA